MIEPSDVDVPLVQQEIFGPVLSFETFEEEADAIRLAEQGSEHTLLLR